jgi:ring-1,2-phenylacetyl-CoA epoxidase subunit PaaA
MPSGMSIEDYLAAGGRLTAPANVPPRYRGELLRMMASFVDSELAASAGFAGLINAAPGLTSRIAACRIVLEKVEHAKWVLDLMAEFGADTARYEAHHDWAARLPRDVDFGAARWGGDMRLSVFHYPLTGWADAVVMNVMMGLASAIQIEEMSNASYVPFADAMRRIAPREEAHTRLGFKALPRLLLGGAEEQAAVRASVAYWRPRVAASFGHAGSARFPLLRRFGLRQRPNEELLALWEARLHERLGPYGLL